MNSLPKEDWRGLAKRHSPPPDATPDHALWFGVDENHVYISPLTSGVIVVSELPEDKIRILTIQAVNGLGNVVEIIDFDSAPAWTNSNPKAATGEAWEDGQRYIVTPASGAVGQATSISVSVQIGGQNYSATNEIRIVAGKVASIKIVEEDVDLPAPHPSAHKEKHPEHKKAKHR
jgi:hypothetical protein